MLFSKLQISLVNKPFKCIQINANDRRKFSRNTNPMPFREYYRDYFNGIMAESKHLLKPDKYKDTIIPSLEFSAKV
jgi:hypothetical protein